MGGEARPISEAKRRREACEGGGGGRGRKGKAEGQDGGYRGGGPQGLGHGLAMTRALIVRAGRLLPCSAEAREMNLIGVRVYSLAYEFG